MLTQLNMDNKFTLIKVFKSCCSNNELDLSSSKLNKKTILIKNIFKNIGNFAQLTKLDLSCNQLTTLPESIGKLTKLNELVLVENQLTTLPKSIVKLTQLTHLDLNDNNLTTLPENIGNLTQLNYLDLEFSNLTALPESIGNLTQLTHLELSSNKLTTLPESIGNLTQLTHLDLSFNHLTTLPESIINNAQLLHINLYGNFCGFTKEIYYNSIDNYNKTLGPLAKQIYLNNFDESLMNQSIIITNPNNNNYSCEATITGLNPLTFSPLTFKNNIMRLENIKEYNFYMIQI